MLRHYLVQGFVLNEQRLRESARQLADLKQLVQLQAHVATSQELTSDQSDALLRVLGDYSRMPTRSSGQIVSQNLTGHLPGILFDSITHPQYSAT
ncbi:hypothetical protein [Hymenobacter lutimineralis]|uniref:hypothetical protein n=1 Tax=Hymenobacter lutimineralis TaxID=2606448 RepID=UPI0016565376